MKKEETNTRTSKREKGEIEEEMDQMEEWLRKEFSEKHENLLSTWRGKILLAEF